MWRKVLEQKRECGIAENDENVEETVTCFLIVLVLHTHSPTYAVVKVTDCLCHVELSMHIVNWMCICKGVSLKSKVQHCGIWSTAAWQPRRLCYRPALFFLRLRLIALLFPRWKYSTCFSNMFGSFYLFKNWGPEIAELKLCKSPPMSVSVSGAWLVFLRHGVTEC